MKIKTRKIVTVKPRKIKFNDTMLSILRSKVNYYDWCEEMGGCFTYAEVVLLVDHFNVKEVHGNTWYTYSQEKLAKGENSRTWFYFWPCKEFDVRPPTHDINKG